MIDFLAVYSEAGMIGVVGAMFVYMVYQNAQRSDRQAESIEELQVINKGQEETLENMEGMIIKLIDRWNKSDDIRDRRHEDMVGEINDMSDVLMEIKGNVSRINGRK
tara:strand:- start:87 stop:407 length:321 start_codon:yes stop_codon:yes gene_type:complete